MGPRCQASKVLTPSGDKTPDPLVVVDGPGRGREGVARPASVWLVGWSKIARPGVLMRHEATLPLGFWRHLSGFRFVVVSSLAPAREGYPFHRRGEAPRLWWVHACVRIDLVRRARGPRTQGFPWG